jgi:predicted DNA-binding protein YlxM (UPF0122 family)
MGVCIHYKGTLTDKKQIRPFINELEDIARSVNWKYRLLDEDWSKTPDAELIKNSAEELVIEGSTSLKGILLSLHEDSESLAFCFDAAGQMTTPVQVALRAELAYLGNSSWVSVKTQFAGPDVHVAMVRLLRYLKRKYLHDLEVRDDTGYWETGDYQAVVNNINRVNQAIDAVSDQLESANLQSEKDIVEQIEEALRKMKEREEGEQGEME